MNTEFKYTKITMCLPLGLIMAVILSNILIGLLYTCEGILFVKDLLDQVVHPLELALEYFHSAILLYTY